ncbi:MAG: cbb3-type cytochrome oxidase assembly protein CcoS [Asticcacaulis sp.]|nr:cbb3-type cytochrome oxidase assembly protein CcoS [Asticcacaulis tiandongensis]
MVILILMIPIAGALGLLALWGFMWALKSHQFEDMQGNAERILHDEDDAD